MIPLAFDRERLKRLRQQKKLTLRTLADRLFEDGYIVTPQNLHSIEAGKSQPSVALAKALGNRFRKPLRFFYSQGRRQTK